MMGMAKRRRRERGMRNRSRLELGKHAECYHAGDDNLSDIQGMVELRGSVAILGTEAGERYVKDPTIARRTSKQS
jgi:hypothetical protein